MASWPLWLLVLVFVAAAAVVWVAGIQLSKTADVLDDRLHLGSALRPDRAGSGNEPA